MTFEARTDIGSPTLSEQSSFFIDDVSLLVEQEAPPSNLPYTVYLPLLMKPQPQPQYTLGCNPTGGTGGLAPGTYDMTVAGLKAMVIVGTNYQPQNPTYLAFYLHGDEGGYNFHQNPFNQINKLVNQKGWIYVAPQSPPLIPGQTTHSSWASAPTPKADMLAAVLDEMFAKYNVCRDVILGSSASGGSAFYDDNFFPMKGDMYPAHMILACGSNVNAPFDHHDIDEKLAIFGQSSEIMARSRFQYSYGSEDFLFDNIQEGMALYTGAGLTVIKDELPGEGHCGSFVDPRIRDFWDSVSNELGIN